MQLKPSLFVIQVKPPVTITPLTQATRSEKVTHLE